ncbi:MAG TPA: hypothetical protein VFH61_10645 [Thermoleophilia bacterium]|nr:hypothetical protein [Thermoleophilia bacterium]
MDKIDWREVELERLSRGIKLLQATLDKVDEMAAVIRGDLSLLRASMEDDDDAEPRADNTRIR